MNIPDKCFALLNTSIHPQTKVGTLIIIKACEDGYYPQNYRCTQEEVDERNAELGVTKAQVEAMETASMFGWQCYANTLKIYQKKFDSESNEPVQTEAYQDIDPDSTYGAFPEDDLDDNYLGEDDE